MRPRRTYRFTSFSWRGGSDVRGHDTVAEVIRQLRQELLAAVEAGEGQNLRFAIEELQLEMQVLVTKGASAKAGGKGGVRFWVLNAEASAEAQGKYESSRLQKVTLKLKPKTSGDEEVRLAATERL